MGTTPDDQGRLPVTVTVTESKHRSIEVGGRYRTDEGPGGNVAWEHRNFFGRGERVRLELDASPIAGFLIGSFRKPDVWMRDLALLTEGELAFENPDAYDSRSATTRVGLERRFREGMTLVGGLAFTAERVKETSSGRDDTFGLVSLPVSFNWDRSDDRLDPSRGGRLSVENEPFVDTFGSGLAFNKSSVAYTHYVKVLDTRAWCWRDGARSARCSEHHAPTFQRTCASTPVAGFGQGFRFQEAGELDDENDPLGGRSLFEASGEVRARVTDTIGIVAFVDAGRRSPRAIPNSTTS